MFCDIYCFHCNRLNRHLELLRSNFSLVGDNGEGGGEREGEEGEEDEGDVEVEGDGKLIRESDSTFSIWASGRVHCDGFLAQIKVAMLLGVLHIILSPLSLCSSPPALSETRPDLTLPLLLSTTTRYSGQCPSNTLSSTLVLQCVCVCVLTCVCCLPPTDAGDADG